MFRSFRRSTSSAGFTLVEMLVVIGIVAVLAALLLPAVMRAVTTARNAAIAIEVNQLASAIEAYKQDKGDYPPNFGDSNVVLRHIRKCYPKADPNYIQTFVTRACTRGQTPDYFIDEGESLVFWLSLTDNDQRYPFLSYYNPNNLTPAPKKYYPFDDTRLSPFVVDKGRSYIAKFCKDTSYIYIDSRSYDNPAIDSTDLARFKSVDGADLYAYAEDQTDTTKCVRPYWSSTKSTTPTTLTTMRALYQPVNATTFQIICAGQDADFGAVIPGDIDVKIATGALAGANFNPSGADKDNITNFSNGKTLGDGLP
jgi:prepilin-type N-terminal cleavage/methylation domain-containing protein